VNKGDFVISKGALYHKDKVEGQPICQLCVPQCKRVHALKLAYNSASDCRHGVSKNRERVRLLSCWPGVCQSMHSYVRACTSCRLRSRPTKADPSATSRTLMLSVRRHVPDKLDRTTPITTTFALRATMSREVTLTLCCQLRMSMNGVFVESNLLL